MWLSCTDYGISSCYMCKFLFRGGFVCDFWIIALMQNPSVLELNIIKWQPNVFLWDFLEKSRIHGSASYESLWCWPLWAWCSFCQFHIKCNMTHARQNTHRAKLHFTFYIFSQRSHDNEQLVFFVFSKFDFTWEIHDGCFFCLFFFSQYWIMYIDHSSGKWSLKMMFSLFSDLQVSQQFSIGVILGLWLPFNRFSICR